jgi:uncharacterized membrane protein YccF (DUF307 family)
MKTLGNILWHFPFFGFLQAAIIYLFGLILTITVIASPIGVGLMEYAKFLFAPFSRSMVSKSELKIEQNIAWKSYSSIIMVLYFPFGLIMAAIGVLQVAGLCLTVIGIPVAIVIAKSLGTYLSPVNKKCVPSAVVQELEKRKAKEQVEKHLGKSAEA